ncbi:SDR family NAD(P)-dependent oxidoreductase [Rhabdaerophilum calidifontis]|uniref:SDR family NAD(P)-dependent oxidoreductase n=1 Tax=Rhabdaerophilum calidifontis TaxID=2604328 RepID=UPI00123941CD|nr:SDR family NAD(P)-dependent oxidoreductase [Rhabdaerophilum calidifontis]
MANQIDLAGRVAAITGGAQGIGLAIARRFVASGARVALLDLDLPLAEAAARALNQNTIAIRTDVTNFDSVAGAIEAVEKALGPIDIMVNNAGIAGMNTSVAEYPVAEWRRIMAINLDGVFHGCKAVVPGMVARGYGRIVNTASIAGKEGNPNASAYSASKAGVIALTKSLGKELATHDIAVNCITPAAARTAIFEQMKPEFIEYMLSKIPRGRFVEVEEIANMVAWLASKENSFTTGAVFDLSGGRATY